MPLRRGQGSQVIAREGANDLSHLPSPDDEVRGERAIRRKRHEHQEEILRDLVARSSFRLFAQDSFGNAAMIGPHLDIEVLRRVGIRRQDVDTASVAKCDRGDIAAPQELRSDEVFAVDTAPNRA